MMLANEMNFHVSVLLMQVTCAQNVLLTKNIEHN